MLAQFGGWITEGETVAEAAPYRGIEQFLMIGRSNDGRVRSQGIEILDEAVHDALQFSEFLAIAPELRNGIKFIQKKDAWCLLCKFEDGADILRGTSEKGRDEAIQPRDV